MSTVAKVTFKLTESATSPGLPARDEDGRRIRGAEPVFENEYSKKTPTKNIDTYEYGSKINKSKIGNKEILEALREAGAIPEISGWSIVLIGGQGSYLAATNGTVYINISNYIDIDDQTGGAEAAKTKEVTTNTEDSETTKFTGKRNGKQRVSVSFNFPDSNSMLAGVSHWSETWKMFGSGEEAYGRWIPGSSKIDSISGYIFTNNSDKFSSSRESDDANLIEGSISTSRAKLEEINFDNPV